MFHLDWIKKKPEQRIPPKHFQTCFNIIFPPYRPRVFSFASAKSRVATGGQQSRGNRIHPWLSAPEHQTSDPSHGFQNRAALWLRTTLCTMCARLFTFRTLIYMHTRATG